MLTAPSNTLLPPTVSPCAADRRVKGHNRPGQIALRARGHGTAISLGTAVVTAPPFRFVVPPASVDRLWAYTAPSSVVVLMLFNANVPSGVPTVPTVCRRDRARAGRDGEVMGRGRRVIDRAGECHGSACRRAGIGRDYHIVIEIHRAR